jgi:hypothetical protein
MNATMKKPPVSTAPARQGTTEALPPSIRNRLAQAGLTTAPGAKTAPTPR